MTLILTDDELSRFWTKTRPTLGGCIEWVAARSPDGYGRFWFRGQTTRASRLAYAIRHGRWPVAHALHTCDHPWCVNADHIYDGSIADNNRDKMIRGRGRRETCKRGHPLSEAYVDPRRGFRHCRACQRFNYHRRQAARS